MEPEDWGNKILKECVDRGISNTEFAPEYKRFLDLKNRDYTAAQICPILRRNVSGSLPLLEMDHGPGSERMGPSECIRAGSQRTKETHNEGPSFLPFRRSENRRPLASGRVPAVCPSKALKVILK